MFGTTIVCEIRFTRSATLKPFILAGVFILIAACGSPSINTEEEAETAFKAYVEALNSDDVSVAAGMYDLEDGFHWIERGGVQYDSGADAAASLQGLAQAGGKSQMTVDSIHVAEMADGAALVSAHFDFVMLSSEGEQQFAFDGWMTVGMVKRAEGWRIAGGQTGPGLSE